MDDFISMSYGNGGKKTSKLIEEMILPILGNEKLSELGDGALLNVSKEIAFSTDSFVIDPYFFPGGDIGKLSVCGTVNDLLMCGSKPRYLSLAFIIEEGFKIEELKSIIKSIGETSKKADVNIVTGDTKVVDRGHGHGIYINTAGIGEKIKSFQLGRDKINFGDKVILTGSSGNHGIAILCAREKLLQSNIISDCAPLNEIIEIAAKYGEAIKIMRDPTRGGIATTLNEFTENMNYSIELYENRIPIDDNVRTACELLGLDPLYSANEGKALIIASETVAESLVKELNKTQIAEKAAIIGEVVGNYKSKVLLKNIFGGTRILDKLSYDILPRIC